MLGGRDNHYTNENIITSVKNFDTTNQVLKNEPIVYTEQRKQIYKSRVAQWKRAGPITQRSVDRNHALLSETIYYSI